MQADGPLTGAPLNFPSAGGGGPACCPPLLSPFTGGAPPGPGPGPTTPYTFFLGGVAPSVVLAMSVLTTDNPPAVIVRPLVGAPPTVNGVTFTAGAGSGGMDLLEIDLDTTPMDNPGGEALVEIRNECGCAAMVAIEIV